MERHRARERLGSVRVRITLTALVVVSVTLAVGGALLVWQVGRSINDELTTNAVTQEQAIATWVTDSLGAPGVPPVHPGVAVQIVDGRGAVVAASSELAQKPALPLARPALGTRTVTTSRALLPGSDDRDIVVASTVTSPEGHLTVYVLAPTTQVEDSMHDLAIPLLIGLPVLVALAGLLAWLLAGRALEPVEAIRADVAEISGGDLHHRVPVPPVDDEVARLARTMNAMLARLEASEDARRRFVSDASHELRSPLAALVAQLEVARTHPEHADWMAVSRAALEDGERLRRIVDDLLLLARRDEGRLAPRHEPVDLDEIVLNEGRRLRERAPVAVDLRAVGAGRVEGDHELLRRVVRNLGDNAARHARSRVAFGVRRDGDAVELTVDDDGPGIPPEQRTRVFERFTRLDEGRDRPAGGTGLGLAIVGDVVGALGGSVRVADAPPGTGARFVVRLPALERAGRPSPRAPRGPGDGGPAPGPGRATTPAGRPGGT